MLFSPLVERAIELAAEWHDRTYRKSRWREAPYAAPAEAAPLRIPVMAHLAAVALTVQRAGWDDGTVAAAFLHDALEDRNRFGDHLAEADLVRLVGEEVTSRVRSVTEPQFDAEGGRLPWRLRKETYLERLREGGDESMAISLADKLHNAWTMRQGLESGRDIFVSAPGQQALSAGPEEQVWFFRAVLAASENFGDSRLAPMREALAEEVVRFETALGLGDL